MDGLDRGELGGMGLGLAFLGFVVIFVEERM